MGGKEQVQVQIVDECFVTIPVSDYRELVEKAVRLDVIADSIRQRVDEGSVYSVVDNDLVLMLTSTMNYKLPKDTEGQDE